MIDILFTSMLRTTGLFEELALRVFKVDNNEIVGCDGDRANKTVIDLSKSKNNKYKKLTYISNIGAIEKFIFLIFNAKKAFNHLKQAFIKASIVQHFNSKCHIWIEINVLGYAISKVLN